MRWRSIKSVWSIGCTYTSISLCTDRRFSNLTNNYRVIVEVSEKLQCYLIIYTIYHTRKVLIFDQVLHNYFSNKQSVVSLNGSVKIKSKTHL